MKSNKIDYIKQVLSNAEVRAALEKVVENVDMLMPASEEEFAKMYYLANVFNFF